MRWKSWPDRRTTNTFPNAAVRVETEAQLDNPNSDGTGPKEKIDIIIGNLYKSALSWKNGDRNLQQSRRATNTVHHQNLPKTLARAGAPNIIPTPSWMATLTGRIGAESNTCGQGWDRGAGFKRGRSSSRSYIEGCLEPCRSSSYCGSSKV